MQNHVDIKNFEISHDDYHLVVSYEQGELPQEIKETLKFQDGSLSWKGNNLLWTSGDKEIEFKDVDKESRELFTKHNDIYMAGLASGQIKSTVQLSIPTQKNTSKLKRTP